MWVLGPSGGYPRENSFLGRPWANVPGGTQNRIGVFRGRAAALCCLRLGPSTGVHPYRRCRRAM